MAWSCGIVGLPNAGKSTLFKAVTTLDVTIESYPFSTIDPNKAIVAIPDQRLKALADVCRSTKITPATIEVYDVAGLVEGASRGEGLGNQFLGHLRNVDLLIHVVAGFGKSAYGEVDPGLSIEIVNLELNLADIEVISRRRQKVEPKIKSGDRSAQYDLNLLSKLEESLNRGVPLRDLLFDDEEKLVLAQLSLLTLKDLVFVYNTTEDSFLDPDISFFPRNSKVVSMCARLEAEIADLPEEEKEPFLQAYGLEESRTEQLLRECYNLLNLITFYTVKGEEARAWVVPAGIRAVEASEKVHTDMGKGFINAEVISWDSLLAEGSLAKVREKGLCRIEGRGYPVKDGDVMFIRFRS